MCFVCPLQNDRREAAQVHRLQQGLQPIVQPDHSHAQTHGLQAVRLRSLRQSFPAQGGPEKTSRQSASVDGSSAAAAAAALGPQIRPDGQLDAYHTPVPTSVQFLHLESHSFSQCTINLLMNSTAKLIALEHWVSVPHPHTHTHTHTVPFCFLIWRILLFIWIYGVSSIPFNPPAPLVGQTFTGEPFGPWRFVPDGRDCKCF